METLGTDAVMNDDMLQMALRSYGYGRWDAPYWFIGLEQGQGPHETDLGLRLKAWLELGATELCDCREFHKRIGEVRWHFKNPVDLQPTWRPLMLLLMTFLGRPADNESLRTYQRDQWGNLAGETCVIELSGLAAPKLKAPGDHNLFLTERVKVISERIQQHKLSLVIMYGRTQKNSWNEIAETAFGKSIPDDNVLMSDTTTLAVAEHPVKHGLPNAYWVDFGTRLKKLVSE